MIALEKTVSQEIVDNISKTLTPFFGLRNFQISVAARLNTDKRQTQGDDLQSRFCGSSDRFGSSRQNQISQNSTNQSPDDGRAKPAAAEDGCSDDGKQSNEENNKREDDQLRAFVEDDRHGQRRLRGRTSFGRGAGQSREPRRLSGRKPTQDAINKQLSDLEEIMPPRPGRARRAAT